MEGPKNDINWKRRRNGFINNGHFGIHPGRLTWTIMMEVWKIIFLSKWVICRFHLNLPGCMLNFWDVHSISLFKGFCVFLLLGFCKQHKWWLGGELLQIEETATKFVVQGCIVVEIKWGYLKTSQLEKPFRKL